MIVPPIGGLAHKIQLIFKHERVQSPEIKNEVKAKNAQNVTQIAINNPTIKLGKITVDDVDEGMMQQYLHEYYTYDPHKLMQKKF